MHVLGLSDGSGIKSLVVDDLLWVSRLSNLQKLDMSGLNLKSVPQNLIKVLNMLPSILELRFSNCGLANIHLSDHMYVNSTSVQPLDLSGNSFEGNFLAT